MSSEEAERGGRYSASIKGNLSNQLMVNVVFKALNLSVCAILTNDAESSCCKTVLNVPGCKTFSSLTSTALIFWGVTIFVFYETSGQFVAEKIKGIFQDKSGWFQDVCVRTQLDVSKKTAGHFPVENSIFVSKPGVFNKKSGKLFEPKKCVFLARLQDNVQPCFCQQKKWYFEWGIGTICRWKLCIF